MANAASTGPAEAGDVYGTAIREALYAGVIAFGLFFLLVGFETGQNIRNELIIIPQWVKLALVVAAVMIVRFAMVAFIRPFVASQKIVNIKTGLLPSSFATRFFRLPYFIVAVVIAVALVVVGESLQGAVNPQLGVLVGFIRGLAIIYALASIFFFFRTFIVGNFNVLAILALVLFPVIVVMAVGFQGSLKWVDNFGIQILIYVMLAWGLNIVVGLAGLLDLGYVAFYAVGAYAYALMGTQFGWSFWILLPAAGVMAAMWGIILGFPVLRLRGDYLAIVTLAFGEIIRLVLINWREVTNGSAGISGIPKVTFFGLFSFNVSDPELHRQGLRHSAVRRLLQDLPLLPDPGARAAHRLRHAAAAPHAGRPRLGSAARRRDRLPLARHQHDDDQADGLRHRRHVRRFRRLLLRRAPGLRQPRILHLHRVRDHPGDRRSGRHGFAHRHRDRRAGDDRRHRDPARTAVPQGHLR